MGKAERSVYIGAGGDDGEPVRSSPNQSDHACAGTSASADKNVGSRPVLKRQPGPRHCPLWHGYDAMNAAAANFHAEHIAPMIRFRH